MHMKSFGQSVRAQRGKVYTETGLLPGEERSAFERPWCVVCPQKVCAKMRAELGGDKVRRCSLTLSNPR